MIWLQWLAHKMKLFFSDSLLRLWPVYTENECLENRKTCLFVCVFILVCSSTFYFSFWSFARSLAHSYTLLSHSIYYCDYRQVAHKTTTMQSKCEHKRGTKHIHQTSQTTLFLFSLHRFKFVYFHLIPFLFRSHSSIARISISNTK